MAFQTQRTFQTLAQKLQVAAHLEKVGCFIGGVDHDVDRAISIYGSPQVAYTAARRDPAAFAEAMDAGKAAA